MAFDDGGGFHRLMHALEANPRAGVARHRPAIDAVIDDLLHTGGIEDRDHYIEEMEFGLVCGGGGFRRVVITHQRDDAAVLRRAGRVGMAQHVAGAIDARPLAVPHAEHAVVLTLAAQFGLLGAPQRGRREVFVETGLEYDVVRAQQAFGALELIVEAAERRAAVSGDVARGIEPSGAVARLLHQGHAHERLIASDEHTALSEVVLVREGNVPQRRVPQHHRSLSPRRVQGPPHCKSPYSRHSQR